MQNKEARTLPYRHDLLLVCLELFVLDLQRGESYTLHRCVELKGATLQQQQRIY
jgi:hypothetical protein